MRVALPSSTSQRTAKTPANNPPMRVTAPGTSNPFLLPELDPDPEAVADAAAAPDPDAPEPEPAPDPDPATAPPVSIATGIAYTTPVVVIVNAPSKSASVSSGVFSTYTFVHDAGSGEAFEPRAALSMEAKPQTTPSEKVYEDSVW